MEIFKLDPFSVHEFGVNRSWILIDAVENRLETFVVRSRDLYHDAQLHGAVWPVGLKGTLSSSGYILREQCASRQGREGENRQEQSLHAPVPLQDTVSEALE
jgi:hypothetical protein